MSQLISSYVFCMVLAKFIELRSHLLIFDYSQSQIYTKTEQIVSSIKPPRMFVDLHIIFSNLSSLPIRIHVAHQSLFQSVVLTHLLYMKLESDVCTWDFELHYFKTESARRWSNKWTKTLYQDYLHCIANFCRAPLIIFSKQFISSNTKHRKRMLNFV